MKEYKRSEERDTVTYCRSTNSKDLLWQIEVNEEDLLLKKKN